MWTLPELKEKAERERVTMAELGARGGKKTGAAKARKKRLEKRFEDAKSAAGGEMWWER